MLVTLLSLGSVLAGQEEDAEAVAERAREIAMEGQVLLRRGDSLEAMARYRQALELDPNFFVVRFELARLLAYVQRYEESAVEFAKVVEASPRNGAARRGEATALLLLGHYAESRQKLEEGLRALPRDGQLAHMLARLLATAPLESVREGPLAVQLALTVYSIKKTYDTGETVAMAHAETGDFEKAIELQRGLIAEAQGEGNETRVEKLRERLLSYLRSEPWRAASPAEIAMATEPPDSVN